MSRPVGLSVSTIAISIVVVIANLGVTIVSPVLPTIRDYFGASAAEAGLVVSGFALGRLVMDLPAGVLTDRVSPTRMFAAGILLSGAAAALAAFSTTLLQVIIFRTAMGFGSAIMSTVALVMLVNTAKPEERGRVLAFYTSAMLMGSAISPIIGGYLATLFGWQAVFVFCALTPLISFPLNLLVTDRATAKVGLDQAGEKPMLEPRASRAPISGEKEGRANWPALVIVYFTTFLSFFNRQGMQSALLPLYGASVLGMGPSAIGEVLSSRAIFTILVTLPAGALADRIGKKQVLLPGLLMVAVGNLYLLTGESILIFTIATFMISMGVLGNNMLSALVADLVPERLVGRGMGMYRFTCDLGTVLGPFTLGLTVDHFGFPDASMLAAGLISLGMVGCAVLIPRQTTPSPARRVARS